MDCQKIECKGFNIYLINNNRFHTTDCRIYFTENMSSELVTYRNALVSVLTYATKNYNTKKKLIKRCQDLYSLVPVASSNRNGKLLTTKFSLSTINSSYIAKNNLIDNILLLCEIVLNPLIENGGFSKKYFDITKKELEIETRTIEEEPRLYANIELLKLLNDKNIVSGYSDLNVLNKMDEKKLYQSYLDMLKNSRIDIYITGNIKNTLEVIDVIKNNFIFKKEDTIISDPLIIHEVKNEKLIKKEETRNYQQSKLSVGYKLLNLTDYENRYVSFVFNNLLGGGANSLLMRYVREEKSLCYYINSYSNRMDNILIVNSGINKENYDIVIKMINDTIDSIINGNFTLKDLNEAKMEILYGLSTVFESNKSITEYYYGMNVFNSADYKTKEAMFKKVSKEDIIKYAKKIKMKGIFFLKGDL